MTEELVQTAMEFVIEDDVKSLQSFFKKHSEIIKHSFFSNKNWLHKAADYDTPKVIDFLVGIFDIESIDDFGQTPLSTALISDEIIPAKKLIELGANVNHNGDDSPLSCAVYSQSKELLSASLVSLFAPFSISRLSNSLLWL